VHSPVEEVEFRPGCRLDNLRDEHFTWSSQRDDPRSDKDRESRALPICDMAIACVHPDADRQPHHRKGSKDLHKTRIRY
jgi:hypothetical protein